MIDPYHASDGVTLYAGDAHDVLTALPDTSVSCVVTSPPYWGLRDYGTRTWSGGDPDCPHQHTATVRPNGASAGETRCRRCPAVLTDRQYGHEPTPTAYITTLRHVFVELARVLEPDGTAWLNLGDSYSIGSAPVHNANQPNRNRDGSSDASNQAIGAALAPRKQNSGLRAKNLLGMPWRVAFALQTDGWIIRNCVVWHKPNAMPESVRDRLSTRYELIFLLVRQQRYHFDLDPIREGLARPDVTNIIGGRQGAAGGIGATARRRGTSTYTAKYANTAPFTNVPGAALRPGRPHDTAHPQGRNPGDVWRLPTRPLREAHFATFPIDIPLRCIAAGARPGGTVLDPFSGAGTTGLAARQLGRSYIGIDLNPAFHDIALRRLGLPTRPRPLDAPERAA
jgi:site-specific DNA-methyltransferase (cytosine-N4-specific)